MRNKLGIIGYAEAGIRAVEKELQSYEELKRGMLTLDNQLPAYEVVFKQKGGGRSAQFTKKMDFLQDVF